MNQLLAVALVCASTVAPKDCTKETAIDVFVTPAPSLQQCIAGAQTTAASGGLVEPGTTYLKITCEQRFKPAARREATAQPTE